MNLNAFWICLCVVVDLLDQMRALLLFVRDDTMSQQFAVEFTSPTTATIGDLLQEVARCKAVNRSETSIELSFQGVQLTHLPEQQLLADVDGLGNECTLSVDFFPIIQLQWNGDDYFIVYDEGKGDVLQWDTGKDITQFEWLQEMRSVGIEFYDQDGEEKKAITYKIGDEITTSHAFLIVRIAADQEGIDESPEANLRSVYPYDLEQAQHAKDLLVVPAHGEGMNLGYKSRDEYGRHCSYQFPTGYGLLLRYKNETRSMV